MQQTLILIDRNLCYHTFFPSMNCIFGRDKLLQSSYLGLYVFFLLCFGKAGGRHCDQIYLNEYYKAMITKFTDKICVSPNTKDRSLNPKDQNPKTETERPKPKDRNPKTETQRRNPKTETQRPKPKDRNPKTETLRPKHKD